MLHWSAVLLNPTIHLLNSLYTSVVLYSMIILPHLIIWQSELSPPQCPEGYFFSIPALPVQWYFQTTVFLLLPLFTREAVSFVPLPIRRLQLVFTLQTNIASLTWRVRKRRVCLFCPRHSLNNSRPRGTARRFVWTDIRGGLQHLVTFFQQCKCRCFVDTWLHTSVTYLA